jgi:hypothetical protein
LPLILVDEPGGTYWSDWLALVEKELLAQGYISANDLKLFECVDSAEEAIERIDRFYLRYHSLRYVRDKLVLRLSSAITGQAVQELKRRFADLLTPQGDLRISEPLPEESDELEIQHLPRLTVDFNRQDFGRLRELIDAINAL